MVTAVRQSLRETTMSMKQTLLILAALGALLAPALAGDGTPAILPGPVTDADYRDGGRPSAAKVELGRMLFFDKLLSGNRNISCATCHHPKHGTSDEIALSLGEGASGLGPLRRTGRTLETAVHERVPRNSPALFNLGAREFTVMFHDGRVEADTNGYYASGFISPARWKLPVGLDSALAAQAMFPVTSGTEMAGQKGENEIANAVALNRAAGPGGAWDRIAQRLRDNDEYVALFRRAYPDAVTRLSDVNYVRAANALAAFQSDAFRADNSPFDRYLRDRQPLPADAEAGRKLFYGRANCASCHSGKFQTDHGFHAIAMPQVGPGKADGRDAEYWSRTGDQAFLEDFGRGRVTARGKDNYKFRTPSLRNVELTAPYGHAGSYRTLEEVVRHHLAPRTALKAYDPATAPLPPIGRVAELSASGDRMRQAWLTPSRQKSFEQRDHWVQKSQNLRDRIAAANELGAIALSDTEVAQLVAFLKSLTDPRSRNLESLVPERVPSGLPVED
jgi:cytochrome c peroxidase